MKQMCQPYLEPGVAKATLGGEIRQRLQGKGIIDVTSVGFPNSVVREISGL